MKKRYKILGNSFKQYLALSSNTFVEGKENIISEKNIDELINSFNNRKVEANIYRGHKANQGIERERIGKILNVYKSQDGIGLEADLELTEEGKRLIETNGFYPSIEMCGRKIDETDDTISWSNCELKALAFVEYPASKTVDLLCASGIIEEDINNNNNNNNNKGVSMDKLKELLEKLKTSDTDAKKEFVDMFNSDAELQTAIINFLVSAMQSQADNNKKDDTDADDNNGDGEDDKAADKIAEKIVEGADGSTKTTVTETTTEEEKKPNSEEEKKEKEEAQLSAITFEKWTNEYAETKGGIRCSSKSVSDAFVKAKKLFKGGFNKEEIMGMVKGSLIPLGTATEKQINLSAIKKDEQYSEISKMFK